MLVMLIQCIHGTVFNRVHYMPLLFDKITKGEFDPTEIISHVVPLEEAAIAYQRFHDHQDECIKVILKP